MITWWDEAYRLRRSREDIARVIDETLRRIRAEIVFVVYNGIVCRTSLAL